jgi:uncharacterized protein (DUF779 family)
MHVTATEAARKTVARVAGEGRRDLVLVLGTGCCDSTAPFLYDRYDPGPDAVALGTVAGVPIYAHRWLADLYGDADALRVDVEEDVVSDSFSLESEHGCRLILRVAGRD